MTFISRIKDEYWCHDFLLSFINVLYGFYLLLVACAIRGVISHEMGIPTSMELGIPGKKDIVTRKKKP